MSNVFKTCSLHSAYHTGCIDCQHDMHEEISILKADNARMREALEDLDMNLVYTRGTDKEYKYEGFGSVSRKISNALKGGE